MDVATLVRTRQSLHALGELVLAGPQYRGSGTIRLRVLPGGFGTVKEPPLRVQGTELVAGDRRLALAETTYAELAKTAGVEAGAPVGLYKDGCGVDPADTVEVDPAAARLLTGALERGDAALRRLAGDGPEPVLWPEHFDVGVSLDEVNYGVSIGDGHHAAPYAYVGPWTPLQGLFWNAPFGALRSLDELPDADAVLAFFEEGRREARQGRAGTP